jgi:hypothetical protein
MLQSRIRRRGGKEEIEGAQHRRCPLHVIPLLLSELLFSLFFFWPCCCANTWLICTASPLFFCSTRLGALLLFCFVLPCVKWTPWECVKLLWVALLYTFFLLWFFSSRWFLLLSEFLRSFGGFFSFHFLFSRAPRTHAHTPRFAPLVVEVLCD